MNRMIWIIVVSAMTILAIASGFRAFFNHGHASASRPYTKHFEGAEREEEAGERMVITESQRQRTHWNPLDEVGTNHRCNQDELSMPQNETPCISSPLNPNILFAAANDYRIGSGQPMAGFYRSTDGGATWSDVLLTTGPGAFACDPFLACDATGRVYASYMSNEAVGWSRCIYVHTSTDNGLTWSNPVAASPSTMLDKPVAVCDQNPNSPYYNYYYIAWSHIWGMTGLARSTDGGASFDHTTAISPPPQGEDDTDTELPYLSIGPNGEVNAIWVDNNFFVNPTIKFRRSTDGGLSFPATPVVISPYPGWATGNPCGTFRIPVVPALACDISTGPHRGWLYACWQQPTDSSGDLNIVFTRSVDNGATWSALTVVNDDTTHRWQWFPSMAVHPETGNIGIAWLDRREDSTGCRYGCWGTASTDGGVTWAPNFRISDSLSDPSQSTFLGDYTGTTISSCGFYSTWPDLRNDAGDVYGACWNIDSLPAPQNVTAYRVGNDISIRWRSTGSPYYCVYSAPTSEGPFDTFEGSSSTTAFVDSGAVEASSKYYIVRASSEP